MIKDWRGTEIKVGSKIVYPGRSGSSMWMTETTVIDIQEAKEFAWSENIIPVLKTAAGGTIRRIDRVTVVENPKTIEDIAQIVKGFINLNLDNTEVKQ